MLIGFSVHAVILAFMFWKSRNWRLTFGVKVLMFLSFLAFQGYLMAVIFLPEIFTYTGFSATMLGLNFIIVARAFYYLDINNYLDFELFLQRFDDLDQGQTQDPQCVALLLNQVYSDSKSKAIKRCIILAIFYLATLALYVVLMWVKLPIKTDKGLGLVNGSVVLAVDIIVIAWGLIKKRNRVFNTPSRVCGMMLTTRAMVCFFPSKWVIIHSVLFFALLAVMVTSILVDRISKEPVRYKVESNLHSLFQRYPMLKELTSRDNNFMYGQATNNLAGWGESAFQRIGIEILTGLLFLVFLVYSGIAMVDYEYLRAPDVVLVQPHRQVEFSGFALVLLVSYALIVAWFRLVQKYDWKLQSKLVYLSLGAILSIMGFGILFYWALEVKVNIVLVGSLTVPIYIFSGIVFFALWSQNDYVMFKSNYETAPVGPEPLAASQTNLKMEDLEHEGGEADHESSPTHQGFASAQKDDDVRGYAWRKKLKQKRQANYAKHFETTFGQDLMSFFCCSAKNKTSNEKWQLFSFIMHILSIAVFGVLVTVTFTPRWVGWTSGFWAFIVSMTLLAVIKYYMTYYRIGTIVKLATFFGFVAFIVWTVCFVILVSEFITGDDYIKLFWTFFFGVEVLYPLALISLIVLLRYKDKGSQGLTAFWKVFYVFGGAAILVSGLLVILLWKWYTFGGGCFFIALFVILHCFIPSKMRLILFIMTILLVVYTIVVMIIESTAESVLEGFSLILLASFAYTFFLFVGVYQQTKKDMNNQIIIYSQRIFPILKLSHDNNMIAINKEYFFFFLSTGILLFWSLLAGTLLPPEWRYVGLGISSLDICFIVLYCLDRINKGKSIEVNYLERTKYEFIKQTQETALQQRSEWTQIQKEEEIESGAGTQSDMSGRKDAILGVYSQWEKLIKISEKKAGGLISMSALCSRVNVEQKVESQEDNEIGELFEKQKEAKEDQYNDMLSVLVRSYERGDQEYLNNTKYFAYFKGLIVRKVRLQDEEVESEIKKILFEVKEYVNNKLSGNIQDNQGHLSADDYEFFNKTNTVYTLLDFDDHQQQLFTKALEMSEMYKSQQEEKKKQIAEEERRRKQAMEDEIRRKQQEEEMRRKQIEEEERKRRMAEVGGGGGSNVVQPGAPGEPTIIDIPSVGGPSPWANLKNARGQKKDYYQEFIKFGNEMFDKQGNKLFTDEWSSDKALFEPWGEKNEKWKSYTWTRFKDMRANNGSPIKNPKIFAGKIQATDVAQGAIGDCYLLSAMSVIASTNPEMIRNIFHPRCQEVTQNGMYILRFYKNRLPEHIVIDDQLLARESKIHAFADINQEDGHAELWPALLEKGYAKLFKTYQGIVGGWVDQACADLTNGFPGRYILEESDVRKMKDSGALWQKILEMNAKGYYMGAGSLSGSDTERNELGIVKGHAYSILDAIEIDGHALIQLRNPWGNDKEWSGEWGDEDTENWTERRIQMVKKSQKERNKVFQEVGEDDGVFWMKISDFYTNFRNIYYCQVFSPDDWIEIVAAGEWSRENDSAGGCTNYKTTFWKNPQFKLIVPEKQELKIYLTQEDKIAGTTRDTENIGIVLYDLGGSKLDEKKTYPRAKYKTPMFKQDMSVCIEDTFEACPHGYTLIPSTFAPRKFGGFILTVFAKKAGVTLTSMDD